jgi:protein-serine/threonine kinase
MTDHDPNGLGSSGLRRIRQHHNPLRTPTLPSPSSRTPSFTALTRSSSMTMMEPYDNGNPSPSCPCSPTFTEDLSRFPSESLHSFSFAHQSEDFIHSRQNVLKRSLEFMKDRMGWSLSSNAAMASAQARVNGDVETQNMLDLLAKAQLVGAGNIPSGDPSMPLGPLTGPPNLSGENVFDRQFLPRTASPEIADDLLISPTSTQPPAILDLSKEGSLAGTKSHPMLPPPAKDELESENSSRTPTNESGTTSKSSPPPSQPPSKMKRTLTDTVHISMQQKLMDAMEKPYLAGEPMYQEPLASPLPSQSFSSSLNASNSLSSSVHGHSTRWVPAAQAIFTTESKPPWTILSANDLACLVFGVTKAEVRKIGILEVVQEERRSWLERRLQKGMLHDAGSGSESEIVQPTPVVQPPSLLGARPGGITAKLLSKPNSRSQTPNSNAGRRPATVHSGDPKLPRPGQSHHNSSKSRGVLLCGDVVPIQKRNGATGSASLWVKEKRVGLIWVLEEIHEDVAYLTLDEDGAVTKLSGAMGPIWGTDALLPGMDIGNLVPRIPRQGIDPRFGAVDYAQIARRRYFTCRNSGRINIPATVEQVRGATELRVSSFPYIAGIVVVSTTNLIIKSSNSVFSGALFGHENPDGMSITNLIPNFDKVLRILTEEDGIRLVDGIVVPEHSFRKASTFLALREGRPDAATSFLRPEGLPARHRDGSELRIDVQMRVVKSEKQPSIYHDSASETNKDNRSSPSPKGPETSSTQSESVYALWVTYSRHLHAMRTNPGAASPLLSGTATPLHQPSPGQTPAHTPQEIQSDSEEPKKEQSAASMLTRQLKEAAINAAAKITGVQKIQEKKEPQSQVVKAIEPPHKKTIDDFVILEEMGQGAYGQVKLARYRNSNKKCVLKYVTKKRILVDTWTRDRRLGTVPLEIHVLDFLRRDGLRHPNIVEMEDFFEDEVNYYIEMVPHGLPGMDLFDYIELRTNMEEQECRSIFVQVARAIHHLHTKALVVHRDIKDENVILDGEGNIKLIDFGSAAYIKSGPFDVFVGTIGECFLLIRALFARLVVSGFFFWQYANVVARLCCTRGPSRQAIRRQGAGCLGAGHPPVHHRVQGEPILQHR